MNWQKQRTCNGFFNQLYKVKVKLRLKGVCVCVSVWGPLWFGACLFENAGVVSTLGQFNDEPRIMKT